MPPVPPVAPVPAAAPVAGVAPMGPTGALLLDPPNGFHDVVLDPKLKFWSTAVDVTGLPEESSMMIVYPKRL